MELAATFPTGAGAGGGVRGRRLLRQQAGEGARVPTPT